MTKSKLHGVAAALVLALGIFSAPSAAQAGGLAADASAAYVDEVWGGEVGVSYRIGTARFYLTPTVGAFFYRQDNDRYDSQTLANGNEICRDLSNGRFADKDNCNNTGIRPFARLEATYSIPAFAEIGVGARFTTKGKSVTPYGTVAVALAPSLGLKANAGPDYYAVGLTLGY